MMERLVFAKIWFNIFVTKVGKKKLHLLEADCIFCKLAVCSCITAKALPSIFMTSKNK
jgi:hypothetical protein